MGKSNRMMTRRQRRQWFLDALQLRGSVVPGIMPRVLLCGGVGVVVSWLAAYSEWPLSWDLTGGVVPSIVLGLLLVFRTNTAYERYWEGRKLWGQVVNTVRNLARQILVTIAVPTPHDQQEQTAVLQLLPAFAIAMKLHLRQEPIQPEIQPLLSSDRYHQLQSMQNPPLEIALWIAQYLQQQYQQQRLDGYQLMTMMTLVNALVDALGGCERILKTPIPFAYSIHLKQLLLIYCLSLPFELVDELHWLTGLVVSLISFTVFGIEEIGIEIENPFGNDPNDLPLDAICITMTQNIADLLRCQATTAEEMTGRLESLDPSLADWPSAAGHNPPS